MRSRTDKFTADEIGRVRVVEDFLPAPDELVAREDNVKVTLSLSRRSVDFFKRAAKQAPRALSAHDPRAGGCLCGEAGGEVSGAGGWTSRLSVSVGERCKRSPAPAWISIRSSGYTCTLATLAYLMGGSR